MRQSSMGVVDTRMEDVMEYLDVEVSSTRIDASDMASSHSRGFIIAADCQEEKRNKLKAVIKDVVHCE